MPEGEEAALPVGKVGALLMSEEDGADTEVVELLGGGITIGVVDGDGVGVRVGVVLVVLLTTREDDVVHGVEVGLLTVVV